MIGAMDLRLRGVYSLNPRQIGVGSCLFNRSFGRHQSSGSTLKNGYYGPEK